MNGTTHIIGGVSMALTFTLQTGMYKPSLSMENGIGVTLQEVALFGLLIAGSVTGAIMPDIDHKNSKISNQHKVLSFFARLLFTHRGFTHSALALIILSGLLFGIEPLMSADLALYYRPLILGIILGYTNHLCLDSLNPLGIPLFFPFSFRLKIANIKTKGFRIAMGEIIVRIILFSVILCCIRMIFM